MNIIQKHCWAMINLWQPVRNGVTRDAVAVCDARSVPEEDLFEDLPDTITETKKMGSWHLKAPSNGGHKWYYHSDMRTDEALLIKCFDSKVDGKCEEMSTHWSSIEIRTLVCWSVVEMPKYCMSISL